MYSVLYAGELVAILSGFWIGAHSPAARAGRAASSVMAAIVRPIIRICGRASKTDELRSTRVKLGRRCDRLTYDIIRLEVLREPGHIRAGEDQQLGRHRTTLEWESRGQG